MKGYSEIGMELDLKILRIYDSSGDGGTFFIFLSWSSHPPPYFLCLPHGDLGLKDSSSSRLHIHTPEGVS